MERVVNDREAERAELEAFALPGLLKKLIGQRVVRSDEEGTALFAEVKRYLVLTHANPTRAVPVFSPLIDEVWHQFMLFTTEYAAFCERFFGRFMHHMPTRPDAAPAPVAASAGGEATEMTFAEFEAAYLEQFGRELGPLWDDLAVKGPASRVIRRVEVEPLVVIETGGGLEIRTRRDGQDRWLLRVSAAGAPALAFAAATEAFYVRELPGALSPADKVALCRKLTSVGVLRVAPS